MQTVGQILRSEREKKGLSIKEVEAAISIRALYINAIEEDDYNVVPGEVYLKGFIRNYSNYLGLNGQKMVDSYRQSQTPAAFETPNDISNTTENQVINEKTIEKTNSKSTKWILISLLALLLAGSAWWLLGSQKPLQEPQATKQAQPNPVIPVEPTPTQPTNPTQPPSKSPVVITAKYTDKCWTSVTADGKQIYEGTPQSGDTITWEAQKDITIKVGNAGGIDIVANGKSLGTLGGKGEVVVKTFTAK